MAMKQTKNHIQSAMGGTFPGMKWLEREADH
jgi:hypothetical protein